MSSSLWEAEGQQSLPHHLMGVPHCWSIERSLPLATSHSGKNQCLLAVQWLDRRNSFSQPSKGHSCEV